MAESEEVLDLRRRARRRLIGASALVLFLVVVPPWLMDLEPRPVSSTLSVDIPGKDAPKMDPRTIFVPPVKPDADGPKPAAAVPPTSQNTTVTEPKPLPPVAADTSKANIAKAADASSKSGVSAEPAKAGKATEVAVAKPVAPAAAKSAVEAPAKAAGDGDRAAAILKNEVFFFQLGAFSNPDNAKSVQQKAGQAGVKSAAETVDVKGVGQTRVVAGPFNSREAAEKARTRLKEVGIDPGPVRPR